MVGNQSARSHVGQLAYRGLRSATRKLQISEDVQTDHAPGSPTIRSRVMTVHAISDNPPRYCIEAMAHSAADVVRNLGGLLFDRRSLGWDTLVLLDGCADVRPLRVIGADCADLESALGMPNIRGLRPSPPPWTSTAAIPAFARG
jgi:hypothetical protein